METNQMLNYPYKGVPLRALTWREPYAILMLHGKIETRPWETKIRGPVMICAGARHYTQPEVIQIAGQHQLKRINALVSFIGHITPTVQNLGNAIAIGNLVDCRRMAPEDANKCFVEYNPQLWCHIYEDVRRIKYIPWKGKQGWSFVPEEVKQQITFME